MLAPMRQDLDDALCRDFPNTFHDRKADPKVTCMCWGFPGDGWEPLIRKAAGLIEAEILKLPPQDRAIDHERSGEGEVRDAAVVHDGDR